MSNRSVDLNSGLWAWLFGTALLLVSCGGHGPHAGTVQETIAAHEGALPKTEVDLGASDLRKIAVASTAEDNQQPFFTETRTDKLTQYPCSRCHISALEIQPNQVAHWDRTLKHAPAEIMSCGTCHNADENMEKLHLLSGKNISFDQAYQLCGQCHFEQERDWRGGAHGKRLLGWAGERVISNCTSCHDPHAPGFKKRFPSFSPTPTDFRLRAAPLEGEPHEHK